MAELRRMAQIRLKRSYEVKRRVMPGEVYSHIRGWLSVRPVRC